MSKSSSDYGQATNFVKHPKPKPPPIFIMITKPLKLPGASSDDSSMFSIMEALRRQSDLVSSRHVSSVPGTISTMQTWASVIANDVAIDLRSVPITSPSHSNLTINRKPQEARHSNISTALGDPEYRKAIARLSLQIRELKTAHARSESTDFSTVTLPYRTYPPRIAARPLSHASAPKFKYHRRHSKLRRDSKSPGKTAASGLRGQKTILQIAGNRSPLNAESMVRVDEIESI